MTGSGRRTAWLRGRRCRSALSRWRSSSPAQPMDQATFEAMVDEVHKALREFDTEHGVSGASPTATRILLGTSGTATTIAGIHLGLEYYDRRRVDGCWLSAEQVRAVSERLTAMKHEERVRQACIGRERADLIIAGAAILEALLRAWTCERLRVADRGLREGILATLMAEDGVHDLWRRRTRSKYPPQVIRPVRCPPANRKA